MIVSGDGLFNKGSNPVVAAKDFKFPVYTLALGDTTVYQDLRISEVSNNKFAFKGNNFPVRVNFDAFVAEGKEVEISINNNQQLVASEKVKVLSNSFSSYVDFNIPAEKSGYQKYVISVNNLDEEINLLNNKKEIIIEIIESRQKILVLYNSTHPDMSAINNALSGNINYELTFSNIDDFDDEVNSFNLVIFHQLPSENNSCTNILSDIENLKIPTLYILGTQSAIDKYNTLDDGLEIVMSNTSFSDIMAGLNKDFSLFELSPALQDNMDLFPPLLTPFGEYIEKANSNILSYQKIKGILTDKPLILFSNNNNVKTGVICGEGIWRWRINDYLNNGSFTIFDELLNKTVQYLSLRIKKERFIVNCKNVFKETEQVIMTSEVYNESYELNNENEVNLSIYNSDNEEYKFVFNELNNSYRYNAGFFPAGDYNWSANVSIDNNRFNKIGSFTILPVNTESINTTANHQVLYRLSNENNGKLFYPEEFDNLFDELSSNNNIVPVVKKQEKLMDLINIKLLFALILLFMSVEWFMRKFYGGY